MSENANLIIENECLMRKKECFKIEILSHKKI